MKDMRFIEVVFTTKCGDFTARIEKVNIFADLNANEVMDAIIKAYNDESEYIHISPSTDKSIFIKKKYIVCFEVNERHVYN